MRHYRSVDDAERWMRTAVKEDTIVEALATAVVGEIEAQAYHISTLEIEISKRGVEIRELNTLVDTLNEEGDAKTATILGMEKELIKRGLHSSAIRVLKEQARPAYKIGSQVDTA